MCADRACGLAALVLVAACGGSNEIDEIVVHDPFHVEGCLDYDTAMRTNLVTAQDDPETWGRLLEACEQFEIPGVLTWAAAAGDSLWWISVEVEHRDPDFWSGTWVLLKREDERWSTVFSCTPMS